MSSKLNETTSYNVARINTDLMNKRRNKLILKLIVGGEVLKLDSVNGKGTIANSKKVFSSIDQDFEDYGANKTGMATKESFLEVYEIAKDVTLAQMFGSLNSDLDKLCLTQHQILNFIQKYRNWLRAGGHATLFLFKVDDQFFVASVSFNVDGSLCVFVYYLEHELVWSAVFLNRLIVPQLPL